MSKIKMNIKYILLLIQIVTSLTSSDINVYTMNVRTNAKNMQHQIPHCVKLTNPVEGEFKLETKALKSRIIPAIKTTNNGIENYNIYDAYNKRGHRGDSAFLITYLKNLIEKENKKLISKPTNTAYHIFGTGGFINDNNTELLSFNNIPKEIAEKQTENQNNYCYDLYTIKADKDQLKEILGHIPQEIKTIIQNNPIKISAIGSLKKKIEGIMHLIEEKYNENDSIIFTEFVLLLPDEQEYFATLLLNTLKDNGLLYNNDAIFIKDTNELELLYTKIKSNEKINTIKVNIELLKKNLLKTILMQVDRQISHKIINSLEEISLKNELNESDLKIINDFKIIHEIFFEITEYFAHIQQEYENQDFINLIKTIIALLELIKDTESLAYKQGVVFIIQLEQHYFNRNWNSKIIPLPLNQLPCLFDFLDITDTISSEYLRDNLKMNLLKGLIYRTGSFYMLQALEVG